MYSCTPIFNYLPKMCTIACKINSFIFDKVFKKLIHPKYNKIYYLSIPNLILEFDVFDVFQERCGNGTGPLDNMRNLEHYLNDIMRSGTENPEHVKGKHLRL